MSESDWVTVARDGELADGDIRPVSVAGRELILVRARGAYAALERRCLHAGADLAEGIVDGDTVICPLHGWCYRAATGVHVQSPGNRLACYRVRVHAGDVQVWPDPKPPEEHP